MKLRVTTRGQNEAQELVGYIEMPAAGFTSDEERVRATCDALPAFIDFYVQRFRWSRQGSLCQAAKDAVKALRGDLAHRDHQLENAILSMYLMDRMLVGRPV